MLLYENKSRWQLLQDKAVGGEKTTKKTGRSGGACDMVLLQWQRQGDLGLETPGVPQGQDGLLGSCPVESEK